MDDLDRALLALRTNDETGVRLIDVLALARGAFRPEAGTLEVRFEEGPSRRFPLSRLLRRGLERLLEEPGGSLSPLFRDAAGMPLTPARLREVWARRDGREEGPGDRGALEALTAQWSADRSSRYVTARTERLVRESLADALAGRPRPRLLEVGCGHGSLLRALHASEILPREGRSLGTDRVAGILVEAAGACPPGARGPFWAAADARHLPLGNGWADAVILVEVLEHLPFPEDLLAEVARCLRPGGTLVATTPNPRGAFALLARSRRWIQSFSRGGGLEALRRGYRPMVDPGETGKAVVHGHVSARSPAGWRRAFERSGLDLRHVRPVTLGAPNLRLGRSAAAMAALGAADALAGAVPGSAAVCTGICYVAVRRNGP